MVIAVMLSSQAISRNAGIREATGGRTFGSKNMQEGEFGTVLVTCTSSKFPNAKPSERQEDTEVRNLIVSRWS